MFYRSNLNLDSKVNGHLVTSSYLGCYLKLLNIAATYRLAIAFKSELFFQVSASVTRVVSMCPPISRFPFDCFFFSSQVVFVLIVVAFSASANFRVCKHGPLSWRTRPPSFSVSFRRRRGSLAQNAPFFRPILPSRSLFTLRPSPLPVDSTNGI